MDVIIYPCPYAYLFQDTEDTQVMVELEPPSPTPHPEDRIGCILGTKDLRDG